MSTYKHDPNRTRRAQSTQKQPGTRLTVPLACNPLTRFLEGVAPLTIAGTGEHLILWEAITILPPHAFPLRFEEREFTLDDLTASAAFAIAMNPLARAMLGEEGIELFSEICCSRGHDPNNIL